MLFSTQLRAIAWVRKRRSIDKDQIREVGVMKSSNLLGDPMDVYVFVFSAPDETMIKLANYMNVETMHF